MSPNAYLYSPRFLAHDPPPDRIDLPGASMSLGAENVSNARLTAQAHELMERSGLLAQLQHVAPEPIDERLLASVHDVSYLRRLQQACAGGPWDAHSCSVVSETFEVACLAAGAAARAAQLVCSGEVEKSLINARPTGHHAERGQALGNCFINNVACAAEHARMLGAERVMIVDWDVHCGNGAQDIFWNREDVLALSIHQDRWYPRGVGLLGQIGGPGARGTTVNVPLPAGTTDDGYVFVLEELVGPIAARFRPDVMIVAAGQDPSIFDPMGRMIVSAAGFRRMAATVSAIAADECDGRLVCSLEGGYSHLYTPLCVLRVLEGLFGIDAQVPDPFADDPELEVAADPPSDAVRATVAAVRHVHPWWFV